MKKERMLMANIPQKPDYRFSYFIIYLLFFISVISFFIGLSFLGQTLNRNGNIFQYTYGLYGVALMIASISTFAAAQITKAVLDTAVFAWHTMNINYLAHQNNVNFQDNELNKSLGNAEKIKSDPAYKYIK